MPVGSAPTSRAPRGPQHPLSPTRVVRRPFATCPRTAAVVSPPLAHAPWLGLTIRSCRLRPALRSSRNITLRCDTSLRQASLPPRRALQPVCNTSARIHLPNVGGGTPRGPSAQASAHQSIASPARQSRPCGSRPCSPRLWAPPRFTHPARMRSRHESNGRITYALVMIAAVRPTPQAI